MNLFESIIDGLTRGSISNESDRKTATAQKKQNLEQSSQDLQEQRAKFHQNLMDRGALPAVGGVVHEPMYHPGNPDLGVGPSNGIVTRPVDKSRFVPSPTDKTVGWELPTQEQQQHKHLYEQLMGQMSPAENKARDIEDQRAANTAGTRASMVAQSTEAGRQAGLNAARGRYGVALPPGSGVGDDRKFLPEELPSVSAGLTAATELPAKLRQNQTAEISRGLGSVSTPGAYKILHDKYTKQYPDAMDQFDAPDKFEPGKTPLKARMASMSPADQQKASQYLTMNQKDWDSKAQLVGLNEGEKSLVNGYVQRGEFDKADQLMEKASQRPKDETSLAMAVAKAKRPGATQQQIEEGQIADATLQRMTRDKVAARPVNQFIPPAGAPEITTIDHVPDAIRGAVQRIINGDQALPSLGRNNPTNQAITYWLGKVDPGYTASRADVKKSFTSGKDADNVKSLNTVVNHLGALSENAEKLNNGSFKKYNNFGNWLSRETSTDITAPFRVDRQGVASELGTLLKGGVASEREVKDWEDQIDAADSPGTLKSTIKELSHVIAGRTDALENKRAVLPEASRSTPLLSPKARQIMDRLSGAVSNSGGGVIVVTDPRGVPHSFPNQAAADNFKKAAGIQ